MLLDWRLKDSWLADVDEYAGDILPASLRSSLARRKPKCWADNFAWLPDAGMLVPRFSGRLMDFYSKAKAFHGCRPLSVQSYYQSGIRGQRSEEILSTFRRIFQDVDEAALSAAIADMETRQQSERGKIWFVGDDTFLLEECGHYLIQGSEYLLALAAHLFRRNVVGEDYRMRLRNRGIPTVFEVDIPLKMLPSLQVISLAKMILSEWGQHVSGNPLGMDDDPSYVLHQDLPPEHIVGHYHPTLISDPHMGHRLYSAGGGYCDVCHVGKTTARS